MDKASVANEGAKTPRRTSRRPDCAAEGRAPSVNQTPLSRRTRLIDLTGQRFGRLSVLRRAGSIPKSNSSAPTWHVKCDCGTEKVIPGYRLRCGDAKSCGCLSKEQMSRGLRLTHGFAKRGQSTSEYNLWMSAKRRAKRDGIEFDLLVTDIRIPKICPVFGKPLIPGNGQKHAFSPSIDRIDNKRGYTKDNIWVISYRANELKRDASLEEILMLAAAIEKLCGVTHERDVNAARNTLLLGQKVLASSVPRGTSGNALTGRANARNEAGPRECVQAR